MNDQSHDIHIGVALSQYEAQDLLRRLGEDDEFRERLQREPREAFADYGIKLSENILPEVVNLPSKEESQRVLESIQGQDPLFTGRAVFTMLSICIGGP
jgi:putative modified peptide